jgi:hypothetical protein
VDFAADAFASDVFFGDAFLAGAFSADAFLAGAFAADAFLAGAVPAALLACARRARVALADCEPRPSLLGRLSTITVM